VNKYFSEIRYKKEVDARAADSSLWPGIYVLAVVGLSIRIIFALKSDRIHHPDEVFQYLEQAHRIIFGYGYVPWEYRFGTRSWIMPGFISLWLLLCKFLNLDYSSIYIPLVKAVFSLLSISLIFSAYTIGRNLASERAGRLAAFFTCFWYELIYFSHKPLPDVVSAYFLVAALAFAFMKAGHNRPVLSGFLLALCITIRLQNLPAVALILLFVLLVWEKRDLVRLGSTFVVTIVFAGYVDFLTWGTFFISYYYNYLFNKVYGVSSLFGVKSFSWYFQALIVTSAGILPTFLLLSPIKFRLVWLLFSCALIVLISHSIIPHKEYRFIFSTIPILLAVSAIIVSELALRISVTKQNTFYTVALLGFICISCGGLFTKLPYQSRVYPKYLYEVQDHLRASSLLAQEANLYAILDTSQPWYATGGYYYLHRDVPIYYSEHLEAISSKTLVDYISHIICPAGTPGIPGFTFAASVGVLEIRKQTNPTYKYQRLDSYTRDVFQPGIDDRYRPSVRRQF